MPMQRVANNNGGVGRKSHCWPLKGRTPLVYLHGSLRLGRFIMGVEDFYWVCPSAHGFCTSSGMCMPMEGC